MPKDMKEPQSYGSEQDWVTGKTGGQVNDQKSTPAPEHREFYDDKRETDTSTSYQGGRTSPTQLADQNDVRDSSTRATEVTGDEGGAGSESFFKKRDYE
jgi:hypothetical protein